MRVIFLGCLVSFLAAVPAFSDNGIPNSRCRLAITNQSMPAPWRVDDDVNERIDFGLSSASLSNIDVERQVDSALQQLARIARGKLQRPSGALIAATCSALLASSRLV